MFRGLFLNFLLATISVFVCAQGQSTLSKDLPKEIKHGQTASGLTYFIKSDTNSKKNYIALVNKVGAYHFIDPGQLGVPHFIEHLAFQGTKHFPKSIQSTLTNLGLRAGSDFGATTNEGTNYWINIPARDSVLLNTILLMASDWANGRLFQKQQVEEERSAIKNEMSLGKGRGFESLKEIPYLLFDKNPLYLPRSRAEYSNIDTVSVRTLAEFEKSWYRHDMEALVVVGNVDPSAVETQIKSLFSQSNIRIDKRELPDLKKIFDVPLSGTNKVIVTDHGYNGVKLTIYKKRKTSINPDGKQSAVAKIEDAFYNELVKRRMTNLWERLNMKLSIPIHFIDRTSIHSLAGIDALTTNIEAHDFESAKKVMEFAIREMRRIELWGFTTKEFIDARDYVSTSNKARFQINDARSLVLSLQNYFSVNASVWNFSSSEYDSLVKSISLGDINEIAKNWLSERTDMDILVSVPDKQSTALVEKNDILALYTKVSKSHPKAYVDYIPKAPKVVVKDSNSFISYKIEQISGEQLQLSNGVKVILKQISTSDQSTMQRKGIRVHGFSNGGTSVYEGLAYDAALAADALVKNSGIGNLTRDELLQWLTDKRKNGSLSIWPYIHYADVGVIGEASSNNAEELFKLIFLYFSEVRKDKKILSKTLKNSENSKPSNFQDSVRSVIDVSLAKESRKSPAKAKFNRTFKIYREQFANPADFTFVIAGNFVMEEIKTLSAKYLGALPTRSSRKDTVIRHNIDQPRNNNDLRVTMVGDSIGNIAIHMLFPGSGAVTEQQQLELELITEILRGKLIKRLRGQERMVYGINFGLEMSRELGLFSFDLEFEITPADCDRAINAVVDEMSKLQYGELDDGLLTGAKRKVQGRLSGDLQSRSYWTSKIISTLRKGKSLFNLPNEIDILESITEQDIKRSALKFIDKKRYSLFKLL